MKYYDFKTAQQLIENEKENIQSATMGMQEDWFWTADTIFEDGKYLLDLSDTTLQIGGISSSYWATPTLEIQYKNGTDKRIECSTGKQELSYGEKIAKTIEFQSQLGCLSQPVQESRKPLDPK